MFSTMSNIFQLCSTHFSREAKNFVGGLSPVVTCLCVTVKFSQSRTNTRLSQILTNIVLPEMQQYGVAYPFL